MTHAPTVALVLGQPERSRRTPEAKARAGVIDVQRVTEGQVVGVLLRQAVTQLLERFSAVDGLSPQLHLLFQIFL